jgi:uncharacterized protein (TIGR03067 family)
MLAGKRGIVTSIAVACAIASLSGVFADRQAFADNKLSKDEDAIIGTWKMESFEEGGKKAPEEAIKDTTVVFTVDGKMTVKRGEQEQEFTYKLDPSQKIKEFNGTNAQGKAADGIYKLEDDKLTVCFSRGGGLRPTEFASAEGTTIVLMVLKRQK